MGKVTTFRILLNNCDKIRAGDTLTGQVKLELRDDLHVKEIRMNFTGMSSIQWAESHKSSAMPEINGAMVNPVLGHEVYFNHSLKLWPQQHGSYNDDTETTTVPQPTIPKTLTKGAHTMDFEFHVPETAPSSFQGLNGFVHYKLKAVIEMPPKKGTKPTVVVTSRPVTVASILELDDVCEARESVDLSRDLKASNMLFPSVDCGATMRLARKGFTPGEIIPVEFSIRNNSHYAIQNACLLLKMIIQYKSGDRMCECERLLDRCILSKIPTNTTVQGLDKNLRIPVTCPPTGLPGCNLINIEYRLELKIKPFCLSLKRLKLQTDVIVGTSPLSASSLHDGPPDYWACCLPSYEEIMAFAPPPYSPRSSPTPTPILTPIPTSELDLSVQREPEPSVSPCRRNSLPTTRDNFRGLFKSTTRTGLRQSSYPVMCVGWIPPVLMSADDFSRS